MQLIKVSVEQSYNELWRRPPECLSDTDVFNKEKNELIGQPEIITIFNNIGASPEVLVAATMKNITELNSAEKTPVGEGSPKNIPQFSETKPDNTRKWYNFEVHGMKLRLATMSCLLCSDKTFIRQLFVWIVFWKYTELIIHLMILANAICLGLYDYTKNSNATDMNNALYIILHLFRILFLIEAAIKILAVGLAFTTKSYLWDRWNLIDFCVVISIIICYSIDSSLNLTMFRLLRMLRVIQHSEISVTMQQIVSTLVKTMCQIAFVLFLLFIALIMFSLLGMGSFPGATHNFCRTTNYPINDNMWPISPNDSLTCGGSHSCSTNLTCGSLYKINGISDNSTIEINFGYTNYDNILNALMTTLQVSTKEGWSTIMFTMGNAYSIWLSGIFYAISIILSGYFAFSLFVPILYEKFFDKVIKAAPEAQMHFVRKLVFSLHYLI